MNNKPIYSPYFSRDYIPTTTNPISRKNRLAVTADVTKEVSEIINNPESYNQISASQNVYPVRLGLTVGGKYRPNPAPDTTGMTPLNVRYYKHMRKHYASFLRLNQPKLIELNSASNTLVKNGNKTDEKYKKLEKQIDDALNSIEYIDSILEKMDNDKLLLDERRRAKAKSFDPYGGDYIDDMDGNYEPSSH